MHLYSCVNFDLNDCVFSYRAIIFIIITLVSIINTSVKHLCVLC